MNIDVKAMGQRIREARRRKDIKQEQLAEQIGIASESLGHIECGARKPSLQTLVNIANCLEVSLDYITGRTAGSAEYFFSDRLLPFDLTAGQERFLVELTKSILPIISIQSF